MKKSSTFVAKLTNIVDSTFISIYKNTLITNKSPNYLLNEHEKTGSIYFIYSFEFIYWRNGSGKHFKMAGSAHCN